MDEILCLTDVILLCRTRGDFRNAQLQAKRNAEFAKRKERELLFSRSQGSETRKQPSEKLTQDDLVMNASNDVTLALRRTHQLMQAELSRSHFAQQTLGRFPPVFKRVSGLTSIQSNQRLRSPLSLNHTLVLTLSYRPPANSLALSFARRNPILGTWRRHSI